ncbi:MAG: ATP-binding cassette domain-containing protein, partial [Deinococcales bacterium]
IAGVAGNGQSELIEVLAGLHHTTAGTVQLFGKTLVPDPAQLFEAGVAHIPEDRIRMGTVPTMSVAENLALRRFEHAPLAKGMMRDQKALEEHAINKIRAFDIKTPSPSTTCKSLSGGNIQKVIIARELEDKTKLILAVHPTYGLDIGATDAVHLLLLERTKQGTALLVVSEDLEELLSLCDHIAVLYHGELKGPFAVSEISREQIGLYMTGGA